ncbi:MAG: helix-turn-helix domain-containing protein [Chthoniobacterales bacterium]
MARRKKRKPAPRPRDQHKEGAPSSASPPKKKLVYDPDEAVPSDPHLTLKEEEVHFWVVRGKENDEIAKILSGKTGTVRKHVENIRKKVKVESRLALLAAYWQQEVDKRDRIIAELKWRLGE